MAEPQELDTPETPPPPLTAEEQEAKQLEENRPLIEALGALDDRQKMLVALRYIAYYGALPAKAEEPPPPPPYQGA